MSPRVLRPHRPPEIDRAVRAAAEVLAGGGLVILPTETVYGLGAAAHDPAALRRLTETKRRPPDKPFPIVLPDTGTALARLARPTPAARRLAERYWPGPLTLVAEPAEGDHPTIGLRVPGHEWTRRVLERLGRAVALPSANRSGESPPVTADEALERIGGSADLVLDAGPAALGVPSTVVVATWDRFEVLRAGVLTETDVQQTAIRSILFVCTGNTCRSAMAEALFRRALARRLETVPDRLPLAGFRVASAGVSALPGSPASAPARAVLARRGIDLSSHRSRPLDARFLAGVARVLCMTRAHLEMVRILAPPGVRVELLDPGGDVPDPFGGDEATYEACARRLEVLVERVAQEEAET